MKQKLKYTIQMLLLGALFNISGCNGGGSGSSPNTSDTINQSPQDNSKMDDPIISTSDHGLQSLNLDSRSNSNSSVYPSVGFISALNTEAGVSCWDYNISIEDSEYSSDTILTQNSSEIQKELGITASVTAKFGAINSATGSFGYNSLQDSSQQSVTAGGSAYTKGNATIHLHGLTPYAMTLLQNNSKEFFQECGDKVSIQIPIQVSANVVVNYNFLDTSVNQTLNASLEVKSSFVNTVQTISQKIKKEDLSVNVSKVTLLNGKVDPIVANEAEGYLSKCITLTKDQATQEKSLQDCQLGLSKLSLATKTGYDNNVELINSQSGQNFAWKSLFAVDYSKVQQFRFIPTIDALKKFIPEEELIAYGVIKPDATYSTEFDKYKATIIRNVKVLQDLQRSDKLLGIIASGIVELPNNFTSYFTPYYNNEDIAWDYEFALGNIVNELSYSINRCIDSITISDVNSNCSLLDPQITVLGYINRNYEGLSEVPNLKPAIMKTVRALIYNDQVSRDLNYANHLLNITAKMDAYMVYLPAKQLDDSKKRSDFVLVATPATPGQQKADIDGKSVNVYVSGYQVASTTVDQDFWGDWDNFSQARSGEVGYYNGYNEILFPFVLRTGYTDTVTPKGYYGGQSCTPFAAVSNGCTYTVTINMDPSFNSDENATAGVITQQIMDDYNPKLEPSGYDLFGTNRFATMYPGQAY